MILNGTLPASPHVINGLNLLGQNTITLKSTNAGKLIEIATDGGVEFFTPLVEETTPSMIVVTLGAPITSVRFTGNIGDVITIL